MSAENWENPQKGNVDQDNNAVESLVGKIQGKIIYRETCGPSALESCLEVLGIDQSICGVLQPSDYYTMVLNDKKLIKPLAWWSAPINRYIESYIYLIDLLYPKLKSKIIKVDDGVKENLSTVLRAENSVAILLLNDPGHFVAAHHIDDDGTVFYNDSWLLNYYNPSRFHKRSIPIKVLTNNLKHAFLHIYK